MGHNVECSRGLFYEDNRAANREKAPFQGQLITWSTLAHMQIGIMIMPSLILLATYRT